MAGVVAPSMPDDAGFWRGRQNREPKRYYRKRCA
jgi:hypothetical protein